jgi:hypothetical protein
LRDDYIRNVSDVNNTGDVDYGDDDDDNGGGINNNSNADSADNAEKYLYAAHLYGEYKGKTWRAAIETGLPLGQENTIPALSLRLNYRIKESSAEYRFIGYPSGFAAPMSRVKRQILAEIGEKEPPQSSSIQKHSLRMTVPIAVPVTDMARLVPELEFTDHNGTVRRIQGRAEIRARVKGVDAAVRHTSKIWTMGVDSALHTSSASLSLQTDYPLEIRASAQSIYGYYKNSRDTYTLEAIYTALPNMTITPFVRGRHVSNHEYWLGLKTELHLYQKTWTAITLEMPVNVKGADNVYIRGSSSYAF